MTRQMLSDAFATSDFMPRDMLTWHADMSLNVTHQQNSRS